MIYFLIICLITIFTIKDVNASNYPYPQISKNSKGYVIICEPGVKITCSDLPGSVIVCEGVRSKSIKDLANRLCATKKGGESKYTQHKKEETFQSSASQSSTKYSEQLDDIKQEFIDTLQKQTIPGVFDMIFKSGPASADHPFVPPNMYPGTMCYKSLEKLSTLENERKLSTIIGFALSGYIICSIAKFYYAEQAACPANSLEQRQRMSELMTASDYYLSKILYLFNNLEKSVEKKASEYIRSVNEVLNKEATILIKEEMRKRPAFLCPIRG